MARISKWPVPADATGVREFLGAIGITRRWIKNFTELVRLLTRLTGKVEWRWQGSEQLSYEILKFKCTARVSMQATLKAMQGISLSYLELKYLIHVLYWKI